MSKKIYTKEEQEILQSNKYVVRCTDRSVTYSMNFKKLAIDKYKHDGLLYNEIFEDAGFDLRMLGKGKAKNCLSRWRRSVAIKGLKGLEDTRGKHGRPKSNFVSNKERIEYLETENAYLKAKNAFLVELRAKRRRAEI